IREVPSSVHLRVVILFSINLSSRVRPPNATHGALQLSQADPTWVFSSHSPYLRPDPFPLKYPHAVSSVRGPADCALEHVAHVVRLEPDAAGAYPASEPRRIAVDESIIRNVARHYSAGSHEGITANCDAAHDSAIRSQRGAATDQSCLVLVFSIDVT